MSPEYKEEKTGNYWLNQIEEQEEQSLKTKSLKYAIRCNFLWSISAIDEKGNYVSI